jgi:hypothetical protein
MKYYNSKIYFSTKKLTLILLFLGVYMNGFAQLIPNLGGQRAGVASFSFLKTDVSPRAIALGGAITTMNGDGYASQWNPAALTELGAHNVSVATRLYPLGVSQHFATSNFKLTENDYLAFHVNNFTSGYMKERTEFQPNGTGQSFSVNHMALGVSFAKALTYKFSLGTSVKYITEQMIEYQTHSVAVDVGFVYKTDWKDLRFGVFLQNFGSNTKANGNYIPFTFSNKDFVPDAYPSPTIFKFGASLVPFRKDKHVFTTSAELNHPNDNATNIRFGLEYVYHELLSFRSGYWLNLSGYTIPTAGIGLRTIVKNQILHLNYAFAATNALGVNHNIGLSVTLNSLKKNEQ